MHEEVADKLVHFHHKVAALSLEQVASLLEVVLSLLFELLYVQECSREIIEGDFGHLFNIHDFMHRHPARSRIFFDVVRICVVMILHALGANRCMTALAIGLTCTLSMYHAFQDSGWVPNEGKIFECLLLLVRKFYVCHYINYELLQMR